MKSLGGLIWLLFDIAIAMIGYTIHSSLFWAIMDFIFSPIACIKWLIMHEVNLTIIKQTFSFFFTYECFFSAGTFI